MEQSKQVTNECPSKEGGHGGGGGGFVCVVRLVSSGCKQPLSTVLRKQSPFVWLRFVPARIGASDTWGHRVRLLGTRAEIDRWFS